MRRGDIIEGTVEELRFPDKGILHAEDGNGADREITVKNVLPGQRVSARIAKKRSGRLEANLAEILEPAPYEIEASCPHFGICGGCQYLNITPQKELEIKEGQVRRLLAPSEEEDLFWFEGILESPLTEGYRNKMELTFGDSVKDGPLTLGMHRRGSFYDVIDADECRIADEDFRRIIRSAREYWAGTGAPYYRRMRREGYLRHLILRKGMRTGEILVDLVTTTQVHLLQGFPSHGLSAPAAPASRDPIGEFPFVNSSQSACRLRAGAGEKDALPLERERAMLQGFADALLSLDLDGAICGILHTRNDSVADIVEDQGTEILCGRASFEEELLGLKFTVTPFSFFQTNSAGAELVYETGRSYIAQAAASDTREAGSGRKPVIYDLYCGTGTISLLMAPAASKVIGVEIVEEAVQAARANAVRNGAGNCEFIAGDVLKVLDEIDEKPDFIILDPPRDGVHPKALPKILRYGVPYILYISCKPTSLARDLPLMREAGYEAVRGVSVNQFPKTANMETIVLLSRIVHP